MIRKNGSETPVSLGSIVTVSLLLGVVIASLLPLLLNVGIFEYPAIIFLTPGGILASATAPEELAPPPLFVLAANAIFYALCLFGVASVCRRSLTAASVHVAVRALPVPAVVLLAIACVPRFNPMWPHGMAQLAARETEIKNSIRSDMTIDQVRAALKRESVPVEEEVEDSAREVLKRGRTTIVAAAGDRVLFSRFPTDAVEYPCSYDLQIVLLFGPDGRLKNWYVASLPVCP